MLSWRSIIENRICHMMIRHNNMNYTKKIMERFYAGLHSTRVRRANSIELGSRVSKFHQ